MLVGKREMAAFALAPLPVAAPIFIMLGIIVASLQKDWLSAAIAMLQLLALSYGVTFIIGLPLHLVLRRFGLITLPAYVGATAAIVAALALGFAMIDWTQPERATDNPFALHMWSGFGLRVTLVGAALASLSAAIFWCVAVKPARA